MRFALIVPDAKFDEFVSAGSISIYWNAYIDSGLVEEKGLMKAI